MSGLFTLGGHHQYVYVYTAEFSAPNNAWTLLRKCGQLILKREKEKRQKFHKSYFRTMNGKASFYLYFI